jgi:uncharacterized protein (TIGR02996 family)
MARREEPPRSHRIQRAPEHQPCATCGGAIVQDELALAEAYVATDGKWARSHRYARTPKPRDSSFGSDDDYRSNFDNVNADLATRLHHLACGAEHQPYKLRSALKTSADPIPDREALEQAIDDTLTPRDACERDPETRAEYLRFIDQLRASRDEADFLVFGDWLQSHGDARGELIAVQHALETAVNEDRARLLDLEKKLLPRFTPQELGTLRWRRGFVRRVVKPIRPFEPSIVDHPSLRFLSASDFVAAEAAPAAAVAPPPRTPKSQGPIEWRVRHTRKPEWGIGRVLAEDEATGLEVEFEHGGKRTVKNVELLEDVD